MAPFSVSIPLFYIMNSFIVLLLYRGFLVLIILRYSLTWFMCISFDIFLHTDGFLDDRKVCYGKRYSNIAHGISRFLCVCYNVTPPNL